MVISGEWVCGDSGRWDFVIEKNQMARMVSVYDGIGYKELETNVLSEFKVDDRCFRVSLSYWPPTTIELATGIRTPPVLLTSDGSVGYFCKHLRVNGGMNLFARFEAVTVESAVEFVDDTGMGFVTPGVNKNRSASGVRKRPSVSSAASKTKIINLEEEEFIREFVAAEEKLKSDSVRGGSRYDEDSGVSFNEGGSEPHQVFEELDVRPRGYDQDFWSPLLAGDYGGSGAVNAVFNEDEIVDGLRKKKGPRTFEGIPKPVREVGEGSGGPTPRKEPTLEDCNPWAGGRRPEREGVSGPKPCSRKLEDIDDEEFDIAPMFDDTEYEAAEIPDMDVHESDGKIEVGKVFGCKDDCQIALAIYAIKNQFKFTQTRTKVDSFVVDCPDERCDWRVTAHEIKGCGYYEIRKAQLEHICPIESRMGYKNKATSRVIAAVYKAKFGDPARAPIPRDLQRLVLEELRVDASYMKCYRAKEKAVFDIHGTDEQSFLKLPEYLYMLKLANPGTIADLETDLDEDGDERFLYLFLAFGASLSGFTKLRHVLVIDGTHLSGKYKGVLLTASGQDGNFQIFPLAFAVVDCENEDAWTWFLQKVERILSDSPSLSIISDRSVSIANSVKKIYPQAKHGACIVHLARNVNSRYSSKHLAKLVTSAAMAHRPREYKDLYAKIRATNSACGSYLGKIGTAHWSRVNFPGDRYNIMTSNIAEQLNNALVEGRSAPITDLIRFIQRMMTRWFSARRKKAEKHRGLVTVEVDKQMTINMAIVRGSKINNVNTWSCSIDGKFSGTDTVMLLERKCTCKYFDNIKIPCGHAMLAADRLGVSYPTLCGHWYKTSTWRETYAGVIYPEGDPRDVDIPEEVTSMVLYPPNTKRLPGRRRKVRIPSTGEMPVSFIELLMGRCFV